MGSLPALVVEIPILISLSLEPIGFWICGFLLAFLFVIFCDRLQEKSWKKLIFYTYLLSLFTNLLVYDWLANSIHNITGLSLGMGLLMVVCFSLVSHLRFVFPAIVWKFAGTKYRNFWLFPVFAFLGDVFIPQVLPLYWGSSLGGSSWFASVASGFGVFGLGFYLFLFPAFAFTSAENFEILRKNRRKAALSILALAFLFLLPLFGSQTFRWLQDSAENSKTVRTLVVQPNTALSRKELMENQEYMTASMQKIVTLVERSLQEKGKTFDLIVLPESAIPFHGTNKTEESVKAGIYSPTFDELVHWIVRETGADLVYNEIGYSEGKLLNQMTVLHANTLQKETYTKQKLLAFGEYIPLEEYFPSLRSVFTETSNYKAGKIHKLLHTNTRDGELVAFIPSICYESVYPSLISDFLEGKEKPGFLLNITNDAWFDSRKESYQHSDIARLRTIENNLPMIRSTVSGVSRVFDSQGIDLISPLEFKTAGAMSIDLQVTENKRSLYRFTGNWPLLAVSFLILGIIFYRVRKFDRSRS